jgi:hypothetical protein
VRVRVGLHTHTHIVNHDHVFVHRHCLSVLPVRANCSRSRPIVGAIIDCDRVSVTINLHWLLGRLSGVPRVSGYAHTHTVCVPVSTHMCTPWAVYTHCDVHAFTFDAVVFLLFRLNPSRAVD